MKLRFAVYTLAVLALPPLCASAAPARASAASASDLSAPDQAFLSALDAVRLGDRARLAQHAARLSEHPLAVYLEYWQLLGRIQLGEAGVTADVGEFMRRNADSYIADRLRFD
ncbi:MAG: hypothetical protein ACXW14_04575, partial [Burkholderiaceae bacterium]